MNTSLKIFTSLLSIGLCGHASIVIAQANSAQPSTAQANSAQADMETVVVTADLRDAAEANISTSVSIVSALDIQISGAQHMDDLINDIPNLNFSGGTSRARFFQIRGIGERSQFGSPLNPSVGLIVDGVDFSGIGSIGSLLDIAQVEVLKGPQGTLYGANGLAGLINITSNIASDIQSTNIKLSTAEYDTRSLSLVHNQPFSDNIAGRIAIEKHQSNGYYDNSFLNTDDTNERDELTIRAKLRIDVSDTWQLNLSLTKLDQDNGYDTFSLDNDRNTRSDQPGRDSQDSQAFTIRSNWQLETYDIETQITGADSDIEYSYDEDWTFTGFDAGGYTSFDQYLRDRKNSSFETKIISNANSRLFNDSTDWLVGIYYLDQKTDLSRKYTYNATDFLSEYDFTSSALYGQLDTELSTNLILTVGARIERRVQDYTDSAGLDFDPSETLYGGKVALKYQLSDNSMWFASLARGYKAGGFNTDGSLPTDLREFDSESLIELETGIKGNYLDELLQLRAAVFYDRRRDQQIKSSETRVRANGSTEFIDYLGNAAKGTNLGLEIESVWALSDRLSLTANIAYLDAEFDDFIDEDGDDQSGRDQAQAPNYGYKLGLNWQDEHWMFNIAATGQDEFFFSDNHELKSTSRNLLSASLAYNTDRYRLSLWGRNLADKDYTVRGFGTFGNDPRDGYTPGPYVQFGEPRIIGFTIEYRSGE